MPLYSQDIIEEVIAKNDIVDVVSSYVRLNKKGRNFFGLCPFHSEKSPSFSVSPDRQIFKCFGCGQGGNVVHFVMKIENCSFIEALQILAEKAGIKLQSSSNISSQDIHQENLRKRVFEINNLVADYYHEILYKDKTSKPCQDYVKRRRLNNKTLIDFRLGYTNGYNKIYKFLKNKGFNDEEIFASKLVKKYDNGNIVDVYRNRLMFPICDARGKVIAFGGRVLDDSKPKYINSPDTVVYNKGRHLYGLNVVKKAHPQLKKILVVEGYMDCISLHQREIDYAVASLGTALTEAQGRLLRRTADVIVIGYDADGAGQTATMRGLDILKNLDCDVRILQLNGDEEYEKNETPKDPDEFVIKYGPELFEKCVDNAISLVEFKVKMLKSELNLNNPNDKIKFLNGVARILSETTNDIERQVYADKISADYKVSKDAIYAEIQKMTNRYAKGSTVLERTEPTNKRRVEKSETNNVSEQEKQLEKSIIYMLITYPDQVFEQINSNVSSDDFKVEYNRDIFSKVVEKYKSGNFSTENVANLFEDVDEINYLSGIMMNEIEVDDVDLKIKEILLNAKKIHLTERRDNILKKIEDDTTEKSDIEKYEKELNDVIVELSKLK